MNDNKKRDIFYGIVAIATLIIALVGATLAYFSISVRSEEGAVNATSAIVSIEYNDGQHVIAQATELIPATVEVVKAAYEHALQDINNQENLDQEAINNLGEQWKNKCVDFYGRDICSVYRFSVSNNVNNPLDAYGVLQIEENGFTDLSYLVRDVTNNSWLFLRPNNESIKNTDYMVLDKCDNADSENKCFTVNENGIKEYSAEYSIFGYKNNADAFNDKASFATKAINTEEQKYDLIVFIRENGENQNADQGQHFSGTINVDIVDNANSRITGITGW